VPKSVATTVNHHLEEEENVVEELMQPTNTLHLKGLSRMFYFLSNKRFNNEMGQRGNLS